MSGRRPEHPVTAPVVRQDWRDVTFLHWSFPVDAVRRLVPEPFQLDLVDGRAWVGLTPFDVRRFRMGPLPPIPPLDAFPECNVRTYVRGPDGRDGIWFIALDVGSVATAVGARSTYWVPYHWATMAVCRDGDRVVYRSDRRTGSARLRCTVRPGAPLTGDERDPLTDALTGRWRGWTRIAGRPAWVPVHHEPWPLHHAEVEDLEETLLAAAGLPEPEGPPLVHWSPGVSARLGLPHFV